MNTNNDYHEGFFFVQINRNYKMQTEKIFVIEIYTVYLIEDNTVGKNEKFYRLNI